MDQNNSEKIPVVNLDKDELKSLPLSIPSESKEIFSSRKHSMDYVTVSGVMLRTGYHDKNDWYLLCIKELLDNSIDFLWKHYQGADNATILVDITKNDSEFHIKIRNTNSNNIPVFQNLEAIFQYDMRYGSKQNQHIISRGMLGDAMKQILAWPYVLIHTKDDGTAFVDKQWDKPLIVRHNGIECQVLLHVDKGSQEINAEIKFVEGVPHTDTEIEIVWPIIDEVNLDIRKIEKFCRQYIIFTTDISFKFRLIDNSTDKIDNDNVVLNNNNNSSSKISLETKLVNAITSPARKAAIKIDAPRFHPIAVGWKNVSSIDSYWPEEFSIVVTSIYDKHGTSVYDVLKTFKEGTNMKKTADNQITVEQLIQDPDRHKKIEALFHELKNVFGSTTTKPKLSLPYSISNEQRKQALIQRITQLCPNKLDSNKAVYKIVHGSYNDDDLKKVWSHDGKTYTYEKGKGILYYPFAIEIIAIPFHENLLKGDSNQATQFIGSVNYSISPRGNIFEGDYNWWDKKLGYDPTAKDITGILSRYGLAFDSYSDAKTKLPCVIAANLVSPRIDYHGHDKSRIDTQPFSSVIIDAARAMADGIQTFRAAGYTFEKARSMIDYNRPENKKYKTEDALMEFLTERKEAMGV